MGSTSSITGSISLNLPFTAAITFGEIGQCNYAVPAGATYYGPAWGNTDRVICEAYKVDGTYAISATTSATIPMTFGTGNIINIQLCYQAA